MGFADETSCTREKRRDLGEMVGLGRAARRVDAGLGRDLACSLKEAML